MSEAELEHIEGGIPRNPYDLPGRDLDSSKIKPEVIKPNIAQPRETLFDRLRRASELKAEVKKYTFSDATRSNVEFNDFCKKLKGNQAFVKFESKLKSTGDLDKTIDFMKKEGYSEKVIAFNFALESTIQDNKEISGKLLNKAFELLKTKYSPKEAAKIISENGWTIIHNVRGTKVAYEFPNGTKVHVLNGMSWEKYGVLLEDKLDQIEKAIDLFPKGTLVENIYLHDCANLQDFLSEIHYDIPGFRGAASITKDGSIINIYDCGLKEISDLYHELAHSLDTKLTLSVNNFSGRIDDCFSGGVEWKTAIESDNIYTNGIYPSEYAKTYPYEDFAESVTYLLEDKNLFAKRFPNRYAVLVKILNIDI